jgi:phenylacetate-CoA ligase
MSEEPQLQVPRSEIKGLIWPALPSAHGTSLLALAFQLEQTQWWSPERLLEYQLRQLDNVVAHAAQTVPFYRERLAHWKPSLSFAEFQQLPLLKRADIKRAGNSLYSQHVPPDHGKISSGVTSGSTGRPITFRETQLTKLFTMAVTLRDHFWRRRDFTKKLVAIREQGTNESRASWGPATDISYGSGPCLLLDVRTDIARQIDLLLEFQPEYLLIFPSNLQALAQLCLQRNLRFPFLREVRTISETLRPGVRELCQRAWGVPLTDIYSASETSYIAVQCPKHSHYHIQSESALVEIIDDDGRPCKPGTMGRVVVTPLHNFAMPLIRYDIGDYAIAGGRCDCGRGLPVIDTIIGRERNLVTLPDGRRYWPLTGYTKWASIAPIEQFQIVQTSLSHLEVKLVMARELTASEREQFIAITQQSFGFPFDLTITYHSEIARGANGKYEDFISLVGEP